MQELEKHSRLWQLPPKCARSLHLLLDLPVVVVVVDGDKASSLIVHDAASADEDDDSDNNDNDYHATDWPFQSVK